MPFGKSSYNGEQSSLFSSFQGVRQGYNLSPVLFALFFNDLDTFLCNKSCGGVPYDIVFEIACVTLCRRYYWFRTDEKDCQNNLDMVFEYLYHG